jgi:sphingomyelin phosphodiesterase 2
MTIILNHASLTDAWKVTHPDTGTVSVFNPLEAVQKLGITADSPLNSWSAGKSYARGTWGKRLDYVLYRQPNRPNQQLVPILKATSSQVVFMDPVPGHTFSHSDHFGLETTFEIIHETGVSNLLPPPGQLSNESIATTIQALTSCYRFSRVRSRRELFIFGLCLIILFGMTIGSAWLPHSWINPIFILFTVFIAWLATTMLYEGFIFGHWECNALMNVIEELEIHKKGLELVAS